MELYRHPGEDAWVGIVPPSYDPGYDEDEDDEEWDKATFHPTFPIRKRSKRSTAKSKVNTANRKVLYKNLW